MNILEQGNRFSVQSLIENGFIVERATTIADSTGVRESHRTNVESSRILPMERSTFQRRIER